MKDFLDLSWRPLAMLLMVLVCFSVVSAPALTLAQDAPAAVDTAPVDEADAPATDTPKREQLTRKHPLRS